MTNRPAIIDLNKAGPRTQAAANVIINNEGITFDEKGNTYLSGGNIFSNYVWKEGDSFAKNTFMAPYRTGKFIKNLMSWEGRSSISKDVNNNLMKKFENQYFKTGTNYESKKHDTLPNELAKNDPYNQYKKSWIGKSIDFANKVSTAVVPYTGTVGKVVDLGLKTAQYGHEVYSLIKGRKPYFQGLNDGGGTLKDVVYAKAERDADFAKYSNPRTNSRKTRAIYMQSEKKLEYEKGRLTRNVIDQAQTAIKKINSIPSITTFHGGGGVSFGGDWRRRYSKFYNRKNSLRYHSYKGRKYMKKKKAKYTKSKYYPARKRLHYYY